MKTTVIFQHKTETYRTASGKFLPLILKVVTEPDARGTRISISGYSNPLPFKEAVIECESYPISSWIEKFGYQKIAEFYKE